MISGELPRYVEEKFSVKKNSAHAFQTPPFTIPTIPRFFSPSIHSFQAKKATFHSNGGFTFC